MPQPVTPRPTISRKVETSGMRFTASTTAFVACTNVLVSLCGKPTAAIDSQANVLVCHCNSTLCQHPFARGLKNKHRNP